MLVDQLTISVGEQLVVMELTLGLVVDGWIEVLVCG